MAHIGVGCNQEELVCKQLTWWRGPSTIKAMVEKLIIKQFSIAYTQEYDILASGPSGPLFTYFASLGHTNCLSACTGLFTCNCGCHLTRHGRLCAFQLFRKNILNQNAISRIFKTLYNWFLRYYSSSRIFIMPIGCDDVLKVWRKRMSHWRN